MRCFFIVTLFFEILVSIVTLLFLIIIIIHLYIILILVEFYASSQSLEIVDIELELLTRHCCFYASSTPSPQYKFPISHLHFLSPWQKGTYNTQKTDE